MRLFFYSLFCYIYIRIYCYDHMEILIEHNQQEKRFFTVIDGITGYVEYIEYTGGLDLAHTIVPKEIGGRGIAAALVKHALEYAIANNLKVRPTCSYVRVYMERHKEFYGHLEDKTGNRFHAMEGMSGNACGTKKP